MVYLQQNHSFFRPSNACSDLKRVYINATPTNPLSDLEDFAHPYSTIVLKPHDMIQYLNECPYWSVAHSECQRSKNLQNSNLTQTQNLTQIENTTPQVCENVCTTILNWKYVINMNIENIIYL